jgi:pyruvate dehydrogenase phosphatase regulatory subunit
MYCTVQSSRVCVQVVICGGGARGAAIAHRLAEAGWGEHVVLLEQGKLGGGTTWHATGLMGILKASTMETKIACMSRDLYMQLEERGWYTGFRQCGSFYVAKKKDRMYQYRKMEATAVQHNIECKVLSPAQVKHYCGLVRTDDLAGGLWVPGDGVASPGRYASRSATRRWTEE